ncbi:RusA family crossover junction endodeoxyribonuclease [Paracoccus sp. (in: a-proteobacteria)]|uniref:RusA family crossover junction endodeoxyribonuclease n=1 Tax=Paracoccus sp. TaxID=267 RepID=UPI0026DF619E|nr:RusA family crossover junction endodeoxyribonuclease [Paracoccus sp. (in: a-proteobacteria)]MDO5647349.1 RusA family crossover junction endodeoxyribonuclease [Paracoccus sp. (in: a-proteobacteria)]
METIFTIPATPVPASRPRVFGPGRVAYPKAHLTYEQFLKNTLPQHCKTAAEGPVEVRLLFVMPPYKTSAYPVHRADVDNLAKLPLDAMTKCGFWTDDSLVSVLSSSKRFAKAGEEPHTKVRIIPITGGPEHHSQEAFHA